MQSHPSSLRIRILPLVACLALGSLALAPVQAQPCDEPDAPADDTLTIYRRGEAVPQQQLVDLGDPADLGGEVLEGNPAISARIDYADGTLTADVFQATRGKVLIHFPFTEHATILSGSVELTDSTGVHVTLHPGDSYLITQGSDILWEVDGARVQKSFTNRVEALDSPGPMRIYHARERVDADALTPLGAPEQLGGVTLAGEPTIAARFDLPDASAGVMATSEGSLSIGFGFAAHATVSSGHLLLTDESGDTHALRWGDAYFVRPGALVEWDVGKQGVQQSFFHEAP